MDDLPSVGRHDCPNCATACDLHVSAAEDICIVMDDRLIYPGLSPAFFSCTTCDYRYAGAIDGMEVCVHHGQPRGLLAGVWVE